MSVETQDKQNSSKEQLATYHEVENTPFTIAKVDGKHYVLLGKYRLTEDFETAEEALEDAKRADWDRMMQVMAIMIEEYKTK